MLRGWEGEGERVWRRFVPGGKIFGVAGSQRLRAATSTPTTAKEPPVEQFEIDHLATVRAAAPESMVLLRSDGSFPLAAPCRINGVIIISLGENAKLNMIKIQN